MAELKEMLVVNFRGGPYDGARRLIEWTPNLMPTLLYVGDGCIWGAPVPGATRYELNESDLVYEARV